MEEDGRGPWGCSRRESSNVSGVGGQHVRISKEKTRFSKPVKQNYSNEILRFAKIIDRRPRAVYELEDINGSPITVGLIARK